MLRLDYFRYSVALRDRVVVGSKADAKFSTSFITKTTFIIGGPKPGRRWVSSNGDAQRLNLVGKFSA
jgi:hypothetical protein